MDYERGNTMNGQTKKYNFTFHKRLFLNQDQWNVLNNSDEFFMDDGMIYFQNKVGYDNGVTKRKTVVAVNIKLLSCITARNMENEKDDNTEVRRIT